MKILVLSDRECPAFYEYCTEGRLKEYDLIISCGDLKPSYLSFIVSVARAPVLYVHGNHDTRYEKTPPEGCDCIEDQIAVFKGLRILGLGGCRQYYPGPHQYTDKQMHSRIRKLRWKLRRYKGVDILVTHAPPEGVGDAADFAHRGFGSFLKFMDKYRPKYLLHGHVHTDYSHNTIRRLQYADTHVINCCERYVLEIPDEDLPKTTKKGDLPFLSYY